MDIKQLNERICVTGMITEDDLANVKAEGFKSIICHRCEGETDDFAQVEPLQNAAREMGLAFYFAPVKPMDYTDEAVSDYQKALAELPTPILSFCRTGKRAAHMWLKVQQKLSNETLEQAKSCVKQHGFDNVDQVCC